MEQQQQSTTDSVKVQIGTHSGYINTTHCTHLKIYQSLNLVYEAQYEGGRAALLCSRALQRALNYNPPLLESATKYTGAEEEEIELESIAPAFCTQLRLWQLLGALSKEYLNTFVQVKLFVEPDLQGAHYLTLVQIGQENQVKKLSF